MYRHNSEKHACWISTVSKRRAAKDLWRARPIMIQEFGFSGQGSIDVAELEANATVLVPPGAKYYPSFAGLFGGCLERTLHYPDSDRVIWRSQTWKLYALRLTAETARLDFVEHLSCEDKYLLEQYSTGCYRRHEPARPKFATMVCKIPADMAGADRGFNALKCELRAVNQEGMQTHEKYEFRSLVRADPAGREINLTAEIEIFPMDRPIELYRATILDRFE